MKTLMKSVVKKVYIAPFVQKVVIDNEISLVLTTIPQPIRNYETEFDDYGFSDPFEE